MQTINVTIRGSSPLLIHRFTEAAEQQKSTRKMLQTALVPRDEAQKVAYINPDGHYYFNAMAIPRVISNAGANHKMKGSRKSVRYVVPAAVRIFHDGIVILDPKTHKPVETFEVDARPVTIPATKGRVMRYRPRFEQWAAKFNIVVNNDMLEVNFVHQLLTEGGLNFGIGDFRPEKGGPFGCFLVENFSIAE